MLIPKNRRGLLFTILILLVLSGGLPDQWWNPFKEQPPIQESVAIPAQAQKHILYGDHRGGGHKHGMNKPCKSEFPENWDDTKILSTIEMVAANDNLDWDRQKNGYYVAEEMVENVRVRVVLDRERDDVVTAYPTNVKRNPCPVPANDNLNE
jgi:hypothetical protein